MGKVHLLTKEQNTILDVVRQNKLVASNFYFTGGTALSTYYLQHRYSEDLDFFSENKFDNQTIFTIMEEWSKTHNFRFDSRFSQVVYVFNLVFANNAKLKVDFALYPYKRLEKGVMYDGIEVDSLSDIAANKLLTIAQRTDIKDFVDLYFLLNKYTIWDLIEGVRIKFRMRLQPFLIASDLLKIDEFDVLPKMIKSLKLDNLKSFFREKAKELALKDVE